MVLRGKRVRQPFLELCSARVKRDQAQREEKEIENGRHVETTPYESKIEGSKVPQGLIDG